MNEIILKSLIKLENLSKEDHVAFYRKPSGTFVCKLNGIGEAYGPRRLSFEIYLEARRLKKLLSCHGPSEMIPTADMLMASVHDLHMAKELIATLINMV